MNKVDVIIPVYNDLERTTDCVESVLKFSDNKQRLIIINDLSPNKKITEYLRRVKKKNPKVILIEHSKNKGFVSSVNEGMVQSKDNDVVLLNSDTVVTKGWVHKLQQVADRDDSIATVTPFSNSATAFSYPRIFEKNELVELRSPDEINSFFEIAGRDDIYEVPTGMGYCMYITRSAIDAVGLFDEASFGTGYGEENDFCFRAYYAGYKNVACPNTFIYHYDGASFGSDKKEKEVAAQKKIGVKHGYYSRQINDFIFDEPFRNLHLTVDAVRFHKYYKPGLLLVSHSWGGGLKKNVDEISLAAIENGWRPFVIEPVSNGVKLYLNDKKESFELILNHPEWYRDLVTLLKYINVSHVHYHQTIGFSNDILKLANDIGVEGDFTIHDYYSICPRIQLLYKDKDYCEARGKDCQSCLDIKSKKNLWVKNYIGALKQMRRIFAPSESVKRYFHKYYPELKIDVIPHNEVHYSEYLKTRDKVIGPNIRVGIIGAIGPHKGSDVILKCSQYSKKKKLPIEWMIVGPAQFNGGKQPRSVKITGEYEDYSELTNIVKSNNIDLIFLPAIWPETFSYTLSESWTLGLPVLSFDIGALGDRIRAIDAGWLMHHNEKAQGICEKIIEIKNNPRDYQRKAKNIYKYRPDKDFSWSQYYGDINISESKTEMDIKEIRRIILFSKYSTRVKDDAKDKWIRHLEEDIIMLKKSIRFIKPIYKITPQWIKSFIKSKV